MKGETELALRRPRDAADYTIVLESNLEEIDRMTRIVDELLFLSRADMGDVKMERVPVKLESLLEDIHRQASLLGQERDIQVVLGLMTPAVVLGDELRLRELFLNLVDNAVKYSRPGGSVEISLLTESDQAKVTIADQGIGISPDDQTEDLRSLLPYRRCPRPYEKRHRTGTGHLRLDRRIPPRPHRGAERAPQRLDLHGHPASFYHFLLATSNTLLIALSSRLLPFSVRNFRSPLSSFHCLFNKEEV